MDEEDEACEGTVYVLRCEKNKYYIGFSREPETRIASHFLGNGSLWTKKYPPIEVLSIKYGSTLLENVTTIAFMVKYGFENVRGGRYCKLEQGCPASLSKALKYANPP